MEINNLLESANGYKALQEDAKRLADKWSASGLLEGLNEKDSSNMSIMLENQAKQLVAEQSGTGTSAIGAAGGGSEQWAGVALPLVRKVFSAISAKDFVSVQPMNLPSGLVFYLDFKYGSAGIASGQGLNDSLYGNVSGVNKMATDAEVSGGLYGEGSYGFSSNATKSVELSLDTLGNLAAGKFATGSTGALTTSNLTSDIDFDEDFSASYKATHSNFDNLIRVSVKKASLPGADFEGIRAFTLDSTNDADDVQEVFPQFTKISGSDAVSFMVRQDGTKNIDGNTKIKIDYYLQPTDNSRGDFEDNPAGNISIPEINVELKSEAIVAKTRKLKAQWTPEFAQDLNAYHSIDAEAELTSLLSEYISMEIDIEILDMLINGAVTTEKWSAKSNKVFSGTAWSSLGVGDGGYYNSQGEWFQTLGTKIQKVSNKIHQKTLRGGANFLVCSPTVATVLESIPGYAASTDGDQAEFSFGVQRVGALNGRYKVYKNPYMKENTILVGFRGAQFLEAGAVYAPYIPLIMTPLVYDPSTFTPRKGVMTRYAKKMIRPEFYGRIFCADLATV